MKNALGTAAMAMSLALGVIGGCSMGGGSGSRARSTLLVDRTGPAPRAQMVATVVKLHGEERTDHYAWLRDKQSAETIEHLEAENAYAKEMMAHTKGLQQQLYDEMLSRIDETDLSAPYRKGEWWYYTRTEEGKPYRVYCRKRGTLDAPEEVLLDGNTMGESEDYFRVGNFNVSPSGDLLAYSIDNTGGEQYRMFFKDLRSGKTLTDEIENTYYSSAWATDNRHLFYVTVDNAMRPYKLWRHELGTDASEDVNTYTEEDERFFLSVRRSRDGRFLVAHLRSTETTEDRILEAGDATSTWRVFEPRHQGVEYQIDHHGRLFFVVTNSGGATNFKLMSAPEYATGSSNWEIVVAHDENVYLTGLDCFAKHMAIYARQDGVPVINVRRFSDGAMHTIAQPEAAYVTRAQNNEEFETTTLRFSYTSPVTPSTVFDYDMESRSRVVVKETPVPTYDRSRYTVERLDAIANDGTRVPITLVMRKDLNRRSHAPMLLRGYGSYGFSYPDSFRANDVSLLDRGFIVAVAHVRGGSEKGRLWYEHGRLRHKMNTFTDFVDCAEFLIKEGYTTPDLLAIQGGSAGGLLMGAVTNMAPDLFNVVVANVPFVDVINTMLDETIPLTVIEWEQWGNPNDESDYHYMMRYSPYDNVEAKAYPNMLITAGLNDPRVGYWEPAKWSAKLRTMKTDSNDLLLKTNMGAGHGGASGRYEKLREQAFEYAFILDHTSTGDKR